MWTDNSQSPRSEVNHVPDTDRRQHDHRSPAASLVFRKGAGFSSPAASLIVDTSNNRLASSKQVQGLLVANGQVLRRVTPRWVFVTGVARACGQPMMSPILG